MQSFFASWQKRKEHPGWPFKNTPAMLPLAQEAQINGRGASFYFPGGQSRVDLLIRAQAHIGRRDSCFLKRAAGVHAGLSGIGVREHTHPLPRKLAEDCKLTPRHDEK